MMSDPSNDIKLIEPDEAAALLEPHLAELEADGWKILVQNDYMARLTRGKHNIDIRVDLIGDIHTEIKPLTFVQESGALIAALVFLALLMMVFTFVTTVIG